MNSIRIHLSFALVLVLVAVLAFVSFRTADRAEGLIVPEIGQKAETAGRSVASLVDRALDVGIPLDRLVGIEAYLENVVEHNAGLSYVAIRGATDSVLYSAGEATSLAGARVPLASPAGEGAYVDIDLDPAYASNIVYKLWIDLAIVMVVTALVALELVYISFGVGVYGAIEGMELRLQSLRRGDLSEHTPVETGSVFGELARRFDERLAMVTARFRSLLETARTRGDAALEAALARLKDRYHLGEVFGASAVTVVAIRAPLFVFMLAEELTRPFLPIYIQRLASPIAGLSPEVVISLPMVVFLAIVAMAQPILGTVTERAGRRRSLMTGAALGAAGYVATAFAYDLIGLTLARAVTAVGFAFVFVAAQGFVIDSTDTRQRARGMAVFVGAILVAGMCGPPIGGILADRIGMPATFVLAGLFAAASLVLAALSLPRAAKVRKHVPSIHWRDFALTLGSVRLSALFFLCALPAKVILVAVCFFLVPLHVEALGNDQATIGRMLMIYPLAMVVLVPMFASFAGKVERRTALVTGGGLLAGAGGLLMLFGADNIYVIAVMLLVLGVGQALSITPQSALVGEFGAHLNGRVSESSLYGIFRLVERVGNALGPMIAGALLGLYGFSTTVVLIGICVALGAVVFGLTVGLRSGPEHNADDTADTAAEGNIA
ncbi:MFS transporter [Microbaculum marinum]|uniref:MFS transporter n=1 Tax=Microbaculum marinum TaxID=1764581 RepID=A0AAW9RVM7_9HYPH